MDRIFHGENADKPSDCIENGQFLTLFFNT